MKTDFVLWARQYSKRLLTFIFFVWGSGGLIGVIYEFLRLVITPETASMDSLYLYLAVPMTCGLTSYLIANTLLNKEKVKQNYIPNYDNLVLGGEYENEDGIGPNSETEELSADRFYADTEAYSAQPGNTGYTNIRYPSRSGGAYGNRMEGIPDEDT